MNLPASTVIEVRDLVWQSEGTTLHLPHGTFARGVFHLLMGEAGAGHESLQRVLGLLDVPVAGEVLVEGEPVSGLNEDARLKLRERRLGFVFTAPFLLPAFSVIENVAMPLFKVSDVEPPEARRRSDALLEFAGLLDLAEASCADLAPLDQHRVSLARALVNEPAALFIESLDSALAGEELRTFAALLRRAAAQFDIAVLATASPRFAREPGDRILEVADGVAVFGEKLLPELEP
jgi:ABC-type lipoprotein export system ATPase subunit